MLKEVCILFDEGLPFCGNLCFKKDCRHRANRLTSATISTDNRVYVHLLLCVATLYAINRTNINAKQLFGANARFTNYECQIANSILFVVIGINLCVMLPLFGEIIFCEDCLNRAGRFTCPAIDTLVRVYIKKF